MCQFWSCCVDKNYHAFRGKGSTKNCNSHTAILQSHGISGLGCDDYAKIEIIPPNYYSQNNPKKPLKAPISTWRFKIDTNPTTWTPNVRKLEQAARKLLQKEFDPFATALANWKDEVLVVRGDVSYYQVKMNRYKRHLMVKQKRLKKLQAKKPTKAQFKQR